MIEGRGAASHDCADVIALKREAEGCSWLRLGRMASSVPLSASQGVDWASSGHLSAFQGVAETRYPEYCRRNAIGVMRFEVRLYFGTNPSKRR